MDKNAPAFNDKVIVMFVKSYHCTTPKQLVPLYEVQNKTTFLQVLALSSATTCKTVCNGRCFSSA